MPYSFKGRQADDRQKERKKLKFTAVRTPVDSTLALYLGN